MITTLTGSNSFMLQQIMRQLIETFVAEYTDMGLERLDGEEAEYDRLREALESLPFLASKKLVVLRNPGANKTFIENAEALLTELPETTDVIIYEPKIDKRSSYYKFLKKATDFKELNDLDGPALTKWLVEEAKGSLSQSDARYLIERLGTNQQLLSSELQKLLIYDAKITRQTIDLLTEPTPQSTIFQLLDAAFAGNKKHTLELYQQQRVNKVEPQQIIAMLAWQLHVMAIIKTAGNKSDNDIAHEGKLSPYVVQKSRRALSHTTLQQLKERIQDLTKLDLALKSSPIDADDAVQTFLLSISE
jgi:DNA polymerase-3 subunit delta